MTGDFEDELENTCIHRKGEKMIKFGTIWTILAFPGKTNLVRFVRTK